MAGNLRMLQFGSWRSDRVRPWVLLLVLAISVAGIGVTAGCNAGDKQALLTFKSQLLDPGNALSSWTPESDCCKWVGIRCGGAGRQSVTHISLLALHNLPVDLVLNDYKLKVKPGLITGPVPGASLAALKELTSLVLDLVDYGFAYPIPSEWGTLPKLKSLYLEGNHFIGNIPSSLGSLSKLADLIIRGSHLPDGIPESFGNLRALKSLKLNDNRLTTIGSQSITRLKKLEWFDLANNTISGPIPGWFGGLTVKGIALGDNAFTGPLPGEICNIRGLTSFSFYRNQVTAIPQEIGNCKTLDFLDLSSCKLTGELPAGLATLTKLALLDLKDNMLSGSLPPALGDLPLLTKFNIANNQFTGTIPPNYGPFDDSEHLTSFSGNKLHGLIPSALGNLSVQQFRPGNEGLCGRPLAPCH